MTDLTQEMLNRMQQAQEEWIARRLARLQKVYPDAPPHFNLMSPLLDESPPEA